MTIAGLIFCLSLWAGSDCKKNGAMQLELHQQLAALELLDGFIKCATAGSQDPIRIQVDFSPTWQARWPRPDEMHNETSVQVLITGGNIDLRDWQTYAYSADVKAKHPAATKNAKTVWEACDMGTFQLDAAPAHMVLSSMNSHTAGREIAGQLALYIG